MTTQEHYLNQQNILYRQGVSSVAESSCTLLDILACKIRNEINKSSMKTITLENGQKVEISEESYNALAKAVQKELTWEDIDKIYTLSKRYGFGTPTSPDSVAKKLDAINKLLIIAKYLNGDWTPDWNSDKEEKWYIYLALGNLLFDFVFNSNSRIAYFKTSELAQRAIDILGEEVIKTALGNY